MVDFEDRTSTSPGPPDRPKPAGNPGAKPLATCPDCGHSFTPDAASPEGVVACPNCTKPVSVPKPVSTASEPKKARASLGKPLAKPSPKPVAAPPPQSEPVSEPPPASKATVSLADEPEPPEPAAPPPAAESSEARPKASLRTRPKCPECGNTMEDNAVICVRCGYTSQDEEAAAASAAPAPRRRLPIRNVAIGIVALAACVLGYHFLVGPGDEPGDDDPFDATSDLAVIDDPLADEEPTWLAEPKPEPELEAASPVTETTADPEPEPEPQPEMPVIPTPDPALELPEDPLERATVVVAAEMESRFPMLQIDDMAAIRLDDGTGLRGRIVDINPRRVSIRVAGGVLVRDIRLDRLHNTSRVRVDPVYREAFQEHYVQQEHQRLTTLSEDPPAPDSTN